MLGLKKVNGLASVLLIACSILWAFSSQLPSADKYQVNNDKEFSQENALKHLKIISKKPHFVGSTDHSAVRRYLVGQIKKMGLEVETFQHLSTNYRRSVAAKTTNIIAKIKGESSDKSLALVSHYDSGTYSSLGASDAGSGVVTIIEGVRAFLARGIKPKNDIIIILTDGEEQGLLGAESFVKFHPWAKNIGLALNFEARGSGGPSYMLIETNGGNKNLIEAFNKANVELPVANSLMYAVYKLLPNDTDLTVFREQGNIDGFNFAFIDDHFDYHTVQDSYERLDRDTLNHQANYLMASLEHFAFADLSQLKSDEDMVYFNFPALGMVTYPNSWVMPMAIFALLLTLLFTFIGLKQKSLTIKGMCIGHIPLIISLSSAIAIGYFGWQLLLLVFPQYADMPHGFTYNGHWIIASFVSLTCATTIGIYQLFNKNYTTSDLFFAPIIIWLIINFLIAIKLPGAGFFILPVFFALFAFALLNFQASDNQKSAKRKPLITLTLISLPAMILLTPLIPVFVIGLGLNMLLIGCLLTSLTLILLVAVFCSYSQKHKLTAFAFLFTVICLTVSGMQSGYTEHRKKPNSVNYIYDQDSQKAFFVSYNKVQDEFTQQFFNKEQTQIPWDNTHYPEYRRTKIRFYQEADSLNVAASKVDILKDETKGDSRVISLLISPSRAIYSIQLASTEDFKLETMSVNNQPFKNRNIPSCDKSMCRFFFKYIFSHPQETVKVDFTLHKDSPFSLKLFETSFDLFDHVKGVKPRSELYMPEPFVITDATIIGQSIILN
ncbi:MAG: M20/M25/M40 family metallo-hydrolase [Colwellia sp.]